MDSAPTYYRYEPLDSTYGGARRIVEAEFAHIEAWRGRRPRAGLALSGGGIRSASFGLGALQALAHWRVLPGFDYLSTVSGGGYIGASLSYLLQQSHAAHAQTGGVRIPRFDVSCENFPYISFPMVGAAPPRDETAAGKGRLLRRLRQNANYLSPGRGVTILSLVAVVLRNCLATVVVHGALLVLLLMGLLWAGWLPNAQDGANRVLQAATVAAIAYLGVSLIYVVATYAFAWMPDRWPYRVRRLYDRGGRYLLIGLLTLLLIGVLPGVYDFISSGAFANSVIQLANHQAAPTTLVGALAALLGTLGNTLGATQLRKSKKRLLSASIIVTVSSAVLFFGVLLVAFTGARAAFDLGEAQRVTVALVLVVVFAAIGWLPDVNYVSTHRYYRDRLMEAFLPDLQNIFGPREEPTSKSNAGNEAMLARMCGRDQPHHGEPSLTHGPYHLLNANVVLVSSTIARYRGRGGDSFILSPMFTGSRATGWKFTDSSDGSGLTLASAMAISGAALSPNAGPGGEGVTRQPVLSALMGMFNIRLGYWLKNPDPDAASPLFKLQRNPNIIRPGLFESFGRENLREDREFVLVTDGGHFENLGLYELVRRRLEVIVVCDASADPHDSFGDLANAVEKVRADFGAIVDLNAADLKPLLPRRSSEKDGTLPVGQRGYLVAPITYGRRDGVDEGAERGVLVYLTTTFFDRLSADLHGYRQAHHEFPDESTGDQFFDERQFEAYRELGFQTVQDMLEDPRLRELFADLSGQVVPAPEHGSDGVGVADTLPGSGVSIEIDVTGG